MRTHGVMLRLLLLAVSVGACSGTSTPSISAVTPGPSTAATPSPTPVPTATPRPSTDAATGNVVVTFRTAGDERFRILLVDRDDISTARRLLSGEEEGLFPNGLIVRGGDGGVNAGYSWHIDPASVDFAQFSMEVCDGRPSYVEDGTHSSDRFCPWSAVVVAIEPAG